MEKRSLAARMAVLRFADVLGHEEVIERLRCDISGDRLAHAYLFVGSVGVGKATVARLLGAATLCKSQDLSERPCGKCLACGKIERHNHPDFFTIAPQEGKRWIRIDAIRELQAELSLKPFESDRRVVVIDGAENMNEAAQNAFLKTLEEPPPGTLIILVAPGVNNLLPTIVSRCRIERFGPLKREDLAKILIERRELTESDAALVAGLAFGSVGAALAMDMDLAQRIRPALIRRIAEVATEDRTNMEKIMGMSAQLIKLGADGLAFIRLLLSDVTSKKIGRDRIANFDMAETIDRLAQRWNIEDVAYRFEKTLEAEEGLSRNLNQNLVFENLLFAIVQGESQ